METSRHGEPGTLRASTRTLIILLLSMAMLAVTAFAPANGGETSGDDLETVRAKVVGTYNYKVSLLTDLKNGTDNGDKKAVYADGISELISIRDTQVATAETTDALWALDQKAHDIYYATKARANEVGETPAEKLEAAKNKARGTVEYKIGLLKKWVEGCDNELAKKLVAQGVSELNGLFKKIDAAETPDAAYALKDKAHQIYHYTIDRAEKAKAGDDPRTDEEKAAEALKRARYNTLAQIRYKAAILATAAEAAQNTIVSGIFADAAAEVADLEDDARSAKSVSALKDISANVMDIYYGARDAVAALRGEGEAEDHDKDPARTLEAHLAKVVDHVNHLTEIASDTAEASPATYEAVVAAQKRVHDSVAAVMDVTETGKKLDTRWKDLAYSLASFKRAFVAHYVALADGPTCFGKLHIPG
ncbi:MAG: hypothetical protein ABFR95_00875 [Actinomycetota bacterium]